MKALLMLAAFIVSVDPTFAYVTVIFIAAGIILMWLIVRSSDEYTVKETEETAEDFAGEIRDSNGPVTKWLWAAYIGLIIWAIAYLIQHVGEFPSI